VQPQAICGCGCASLVCCIVLNFVALCCTLRLWDLLSSVACDVVPPDSIPSWSLHKVTAVQASPIVGLSHSQQLGSTANNTPMRSNFCLGPHDKAQTATLVACFVL
jgi:hypothetical protein